MQQRRSPADWQRLIAEFESSTQSLSDFCAAHNLNANYFARCRRRFRPDKKVPFVPVRLAAGTRTITLQVQDVTIRCDAGTPSSWLRDLIHALRT